MNDKLDKLFSFCIFILLLITGFFYQFKVIAMHYIYGWITYAILGISLIFSWNKLKIKLHIVNLSISILTFLSIFIVHIIVSNNPYTLSYEELNDGIKITGYKNNIHNDYKDFTLEIPSHINGKEVKVIGRNALKNLRINCIPNTVEIIEDYAFSYSIFDEIIFSEKLQYIGDYAFENVQNCASLSFPYETFIIPSSVKYVGEYPFHTGSIIIIEDSESIKNWHWIWHDTQAIASKIYMDSITFKKIDGVLYVLHKDMTATVCQILGDGNIIIKDKIIHQNMEYEVKVIDTGAVFYSNGIKEITIPNTVNKINSRAFMFSEVIINTSLKKIYIPSSVLYMGESVFNNCPNLVIDIQHQQKPKGWDDDWNPNNLIENWNVN